MYSGGKSILTANNCYRELKINFKAVLYNPLKWFQAIQLVLNMEITKIGRFTAARFSYCTLCMYYAEHLVLTKKCHNIFKAPI
jgi:hypothetical protein